MNRVLKYLLFGIGIIVVVFAIWYLRSIVAYILIAAVLSLIGRPLINFLGKIRIKNFTLPQALSAIITVFVLWLVICTAAFRKASGSISKNRRGIPET